MSCQCSTDIRMFIWYYTLHKLAKQYFFCFFAMIGLLTQNRIKLTLLWFCVLLGCWNVDKPATLPLTNGWYWNLWKEVETVIVGTHNKNLLHWDNSKSSVNCTNSNMYRKLLQNSQEQVHEMESICNLLTWTINLNLIRDVCKTLTSGPF